MKRVRIGLVVLMAAIMLQPGMYYTTGNRSGYSDIPDTDPLCMAVQLLKNAGIMWGYG